MTDREKEIMALIEMNPMISQKEIADELGITRSSVGVHILNLMKKGFVLGKGYVVRRPSEVVVIGGSNMDIVGSPNIRLLNNDSAPGRITYSAGGVARNIAENLGRMGIACRLITAVGDDDNGKRLLESCRQTGVNVEGVYVSRQESTSTYLSLHDDGGEMVYALSDMDIVDNLTPEYLELHATTISQAACVVMDANLSQESIRYLLEKHGGQTFFVDPVSVTKSRKLKDVLKHIHTMKPNCHEASELVGKKLADGDLAVSALRSTGLKHPYVSCGSAGVHYLKSGEPCCRKSEATQVVNTSGAGDAFMAGLVYGFLHGLDEDEVISVAQGVSKLTIESQHTVSPLLTPIFMENLRRNLK